MHEEPLRIKARWADIGVAYVGTWEEEGEEFLFSFRLRHSASPVVYPESMSTTPAPILMDLRELLEGRRQEVADYCGVDLSEIAHYIGGRREPRLRVARKLADFLKVSLDDLWLLLKEAK